MFERVERERLEILSQFQNFSGEESPSRSNCQNGASKRGFRENAGMRAEIVGDFVVSIGIVESGLAPSFLLPSPASNLAVGSLKYACIDEETKSMRAHRRF
jgi:hypothetical protein